MNLKEYNKGKVDLNKLSKSEYEKRQKYLSKIVNDCLFEIYEYGSCCVYTKEVLNLLLKKSPNTIAAWNDDDKYFQCYKLEYTEY